MGSKCLLPPVCGVLVWQPKQTGDQGWRGVTAAEWFRSSVKGAGSFCGGSPSSGVGWCWFANWPPFVEHGERLKTEAAIPGCQVAGLASKGTHSQACLDDPRQGDLCARLPNLKVHREALSGLSDGAIRWPQHSTVSRPRPWGSLRVGKASRAHIPRTREGVRSLQGPGSSFQANRRSRPLSSR